MSLFSLENTKDNNFKCWYFTLSWTLLKFSVISHFFLELAQAAVPFIPQIGTLPIPGLQPAILRRC